jgi:anti-anti-sigma factor
LREQRSHIEEETMCSADQPHKLSDADSDPDTADPGNAGNGKTATGSSPIGLVVSHLTGTCVVSVSGELDVVTAPALIHCVRRELDSGARSLVIDLEKVQFLGSAGLGALVESSSALAGVAPGSILHLSGTSHRAVRRPLEMVGLLPLFAVYPTLDDALSKIESIGGDCDDVAG